jgi:hypothetical protein
MHSFAQAAGYFEGYSSATEIEQKVYNGELHNFVYAADTAAWLDANRLFMSDMIVEAQSLPAGHPRRIYWYQLGLVLDQLSGMYRGYLAARNGIAVHCHKCMSSCIKERGR